MTMFPAEKDMLEKTRWMTTRSVNRLGRELVYEGFSPRTVSKQMAHHHQLSKLRRGDLEDEVVSDLVGVGCS